jgi:hypothetical protein
MVGGVPLALLATRAASHRAGLDRCPHDAEIDRGLAGHDAAGGLAGVCAVEAEANAPDQLLQVLLAEAGVGAAGTGTGTVEALLDTAQERVAIKGARLRMRLYQFSNCHFPSFLVPASLLRRRSPLDPLSKDGDLLVWAPPQGIVPLLRRPRIASPFAATSSCDQRSIGSSVADN